MLLAFNIFSNAKLSSSKPFLLSLIALIALKSISFLFLGKFHNSLNRSLSNCLYFSVFIGFGKFICFLSL